MVQRDDRWADHWLLGTKVDKLWHGSLNFVYLNSYHDGRQIELAAGPFHFVGISQLGIRAALKAV